MVTRSAATGEHDKSVRAFLRPCFYALAAPHSLAFTNPILCISVHFHTHVFGPHDTWEIKRRLPPAEGKREMICKSGLSKFFLVIKNSDLVPKRMSVRRIHSIAILPKCTFYHQETVTRLVSDINYFLRRILIKYKIAFSIFFKRKI